MRDYGTVPTQFWIHPVYSKLSIAAKLIAVYLLTCSHTNMLGCFRLPEAYIIVDLSIDKETVHAALKELIEIGFLSVDVEQGWILIHPFLEWNQLENTNQAKHVIRLFEKISSQLSFYPKLVEILKTLSELFDEGFQNRLQTLSKELGKGFETVSQPFRNQEQDQEQKQDQEKEQEQSICAALSDETATPMPNDIVITLPLVDKTEFPITKRQVTEWQQLFPAVDIVQTLRHIRAWNLSNKKKQKTQSGILRHITQWLTKEQNCPSHRTLYPPNRQNLYEHNCAVGQQWLEASQDLPVKEKG